MQDFLGSSRSQGAAQKQGGSNKFFVDSVGREFSPVVMVLSTTLADNLCKKNGLSFVDLLRPHCALHGINVPVRTASDQPYRIQDFQLRVFHSLDIAQPQTETAEEYLAQVVTDAGDEAAAELDGSPSDISSLVKMTAAESPTSWYHRYRQEFERTLAFSEHETIDHPVACLFVASTSESDPLAAFSFLYQPDCLPALFNEQAMDPKLLKYYVLLHDVREGDAERAASVLQDVRNVFGAEVCRILPINSRLAPVEEDLPDDGDNQRSGAGAPVSDIWSAHMLHKIQPPPAPDMDASSSIPHTPSSGPATPVVGGSARISPDPVVGQLGERLTLEDVEQISSFMMDLGVKHVIPHLETKIRDLNHQISAQRKGIKNQLKNLWFRKGKDDIPEATGGLYSFNSQESQIRLLADYAFMLRDYELALSNYRLVAGDYRADKAWKRYAGTQEMVGLCLFMLNQSVRDMEVSMESAYSLYQRSGPSNARYGTRTVLRFVEMYKSKGMYREAASVLMRASLEEGNLRAGALLEQAALCFLRATPPMICKYGFHMVLAGHRYNQCGQRKHAIRAYKCVVGVYEGLGWNYINDHVNFALGRLSTYLGKTDSAVTSFMKLLTSAHQSPTVQKTFLHEFLYVVQAKGIGDGGAPTLDLDLPRVNVERVHVHFEDQRTFASADAAAVKERTWLDLEEGVVPAAGALPTWLDASRLRAGNSELVATNTCVAGEEVSVEVEFSNPLQVPIEVSCVRLVCEFSPPVEGAGGEEKKVLTRATSSPTFKHASLAAKVDWSPDNHPQSTQHHGHSQSQGSNYPPRTSSLSDMRTGSEGDIAQALDSEEQAGEGRELGVGETVDADVSTTGEEEAQEPFSVQEEAFSLKGGDCIKVRLRARPLHEGMLRVVGVQWVLANTARGQRNFAIKGPRRKRPKGGGAFRDRELPPHLRLTFKVIPPMPRLETHLHALPTVMNEGELHRLVLELSNAGPVGLKRMKLKTSEPTSFMVGQPGDLDLEFPACLEVGHQGVPGKEQGAGGAEALGDPGGPKNSYTFSFPQSSMVDGGLTVLWPVWLHARSAGTLFVHAVVYYEPTTVAGSMKYRTLRIVHKVQVLPSLHFNVRISPSPIHLSRHVMRLDVQNGHASESFHLRQVSCSGATWRLAGLPSPGQGSGPGSGTGSGSSTDLFIQPGQTSTIFFHLEAVWSGSAMSDKEGTMTRGASASSSSDLSLPSAEGDQPPLLDTHHGPVLRFHSRERHLAQVQARQAQSTTHPRSEDHREGPEAAPLDLILMWEQDASSADAARLSSALASPKRIGMHHLCHNRISVPSPVRWSLSGFPSISHDFSLGGVCEFPLHLNLRNCSNRLATVRVATVDPAVPPTAADGAAGALLSPRSPTALPQQRGGWFMPLSPTGESSGRQVAAGGGPSAAARAQPGQQQQLPASDASPPWPAGAATAAEEAQPCGTTPSGSFTWSGKTASTVNGLRPGEQISVPLSVVVFAPGVYDLSKYKVAWELGDLSSTKSSSAVNKKGEGRGRSTSVSPLRSPKRSGLPPKAGKGVNFGSSSPRAFQGKGKPKDGAVTAVDTKEELSGWGVGQSFIVTVVDRKTVLMV